MKGPKIPVVLIDVDVEGRWHWSLRSSNRQVEAVSKPKGYGTPRGAHEAAHRVAVMFREMNDLNHAGEKWLVRVQFKEGGTLKQVERSHRVKKKLKQLQDALKEAGVGL